MVSLLPDNMYADLLAVPVHHIFFEFPSFSLSIAVQAWFAIMFYFNCHGLVVGSAASRPAATCCQPNRWHTAQGETANTTWKARAPWLSVNNLPNRPGGSLTLRTGRVSAPASCCDAMQLVFVVYLFVLISLSLGFSLLCQYNKH